LRCTHRTDPIPKIRYLTLGLAVKSKYILAVSNQNINLLCYQIKIQISPIIKSNTCKKTNRDQLTFLVLRAVTPPQQYHSLVAPPCKLSKRNMCLICDDDFTPSVPPSPALRRRSFDIFCPATSPRAISETGCPVWGMLTTNNAHELREIADRLNILDMSRCAQGWSC
jgi:hypothetical protein